MSETTDQRRARLRRRQRWVNRRDSAVTILGYLMIGFLSHVIFWGEPAMTWTFAAHVVAWPIYATIALFAGFFGFMALMMAFALIGALCMAIVGRRP